MSKRLESKCKICRREGQKLFLRGEKCASPKCPFIKRNYPPGVHGPGSKPRLTGYGIQLREKQKTKRIYGVLETQFRNYVRKAVKTMGASTEEIVRLLETRLDNVVYRLGFARSRAEARTLLSHGHFTVNGRKINIPSFQVRSGDIITLVKKERGKALFKETVESRLSKHQTVSWLSLDPAKWQGKVLNLPEGNDLEQGFDPKLIIEFYSR